MVYWLFIGCVFSHLIACIQSSRSSGLEALSLYDWCLPCTTLPLFSVLQALIFCPLRLYNSKQYCSDTNTKWWEWAAVVLFNNPDSVWNVHTYFTHNKRVQYLFACVCELSDTKVLQRNDPDGVFVLWGGGIRHTLHKLINLMDSGVTHTTSCLIQDAVKVSVSRIIITDIIRVP